MIPTALSRRAKASRRLLPLLGLLATLLLLEPAMAKQDDRQQPMNYVAKHTDAFNQPNGISTLTGGVVITQGTLKATGDMAKIYLDGDSQISRVVLTGNPAHIQQLDDNNQLMTGTSLTIDYDNIHGIAVLTTNAVATQQGRGEFHGDKLTYNTQTSQMTGEAAGDGLVHGTFLPKPKPGAPGAPTAAKPATPAPAASAAGK